MYAKMPLSMETRQLIKPQAVIAAPNSQAYVVHNLLPSVFVPLRDPRLLSDDSNTMPIFQYLTASRFLPSDHANMPLSPDPRRPYSALMAVHDVPTV